MEECLCGMNVYPLGSTVRELIAFSLIISGHGL